MTVSPTGDRRRAYRHQPALTSGRTADTQRARTLRRVGLTQLRPAGRDLPVRGWFRSPRNAGRCRTSAGREHRRRALRDSVAMARPYNCEVPAPSYKIRFTPLVARRHRYARDNLARGVWGDDDHLFRSARNNRLGFSGEVMVDSEARVFARHQPRLALQYIPRLSFPYYFP